MVGRVKTYESIVKGNNISEPGIPESFKVLLKELQSLALDMKVLTENHEELKLKDLIDDDMDVRHETRQRTEYEEVSIVEDRPAEKEEEDTFDDSIFEEEPEIDDSIFEEETVFAGFDDEYSDVDDFDFDEEDK